MYQPPVESYDIGQHIKTEGLILTQVNKFKYLGSTVANIRLDVELDTQMSNASKAFGELRKQIWISKDHSIRIKCAVYHAVVLSTLLYGTET